MKVYGGNECGAVHNGPFQQTGESKGNFLVYVCNKQKHTGGEHHDSHARKTWR